MSTEGTRDSLCRKECLLGLSGKKFGTLVPLIMAVKNVVAQKRHLPATHKE
jgi:hypothetical protein